MRRIAKVGWPSFEGARAGTLRWLGVTRQARGQHSRRRLHVSASIDHRVVIITVFTRRSRCRRTFRTPPYRGHVYAPPSGKPGGARRCPDQAGPRVDLLSSFATLRLCLRSEQLRPVMQCTYPRMCHSTIEHEKAFPVGLPYLCRIHRFFRGNAFQTHEYAESDEHEVEHVSHKILRSI
jgi:hypothetical protein